MSAINFILSLARKLLAKESKGITTIPNKMAVEQKVHPPLGLVRLNLHHESECRIVKRHCVHGADKDKGKTFHFLLPRGRNKSSHAWFCAVLIPDIQRQILMH